MPAAHAESIRSTRLDGKILNNGQLSISTRFITELPEQLEDALKQVKEGGQLILKEMRLIAAMDAHYL